jgi:hypothetical protein
MPVAAAAATTATSPRSMRRLRSRASTIEQLSTAAAENRSCE